ncbi:hypothetical protein MGYG_06668 [Nannizzia gypsea CBS 118893]|uniref:Pre-mRNA splicing factor CLF1 n=1 Tax=Arthroderma gypseum (strain ATCC MYA-4604 / CBS 118893) TaxID=535722 RepID=E4V0V7_ARTGP|nr:hypothetical protein MGYG_06668 [Nannizzia gypsea CBS 118893]EFR03672.1 hypothetical protein MGYG_06668 [Nannizzia gypsea CBS 118893]
MPSPKPPFELKDHCTLIHQNVLYVYSPAGFMSLALEPNAKWSKLAVGRSVTGASCFKGPTDGDMNNPAFFVVGGTGGPDDYLGVQSYSFLDKKWRFPSLDGNNLKNRVNHDAVFIESQSSILVFAGSTNGNPTPSTETFMISMSPNLYHIESRGGPVAPSTKPVLLPWGKDTVLLIAGSGDNKVYQFKDNAWHMFDYALESPIADPTNTPIIANPYIDGNMALQVFDLAASPITVRTDNLVPPGAPHRRSIHSRHHNHVNSIIQKRDSYPAYNSTLAPTGSRTGASIASDPGYNNRVVISGGNSEEPIVIFNQDDNAWLDIKHFFSVSTTSSASSSTMTPSSMTAISSTSTPIITSAPTFTPYPTETESPTSSERVDSIVPPDGRTLTIIGATLGTLLGIGAIIIIILLILAWRRRTSLYCQHTKEKHMNSDDKDRFSFQDAGVEPLTQSIQPIARGPVPSTDSWAYISGQADDYSRASLNPPPPPPTRGMPISEKSPSPLRVVETTRDERPDSDVYPPVSTKQVFGAVVDHRQSEADDRLTDEGWSKYFQREKDNGSVKSRVSSVDSKYSKSDYKSDYQSDYRGSGWPHTSAQVPPLRFGGPQPLGMVPSGSPSTETPPKWSFPQHQAMSAKISNADSISINSDDYYDNQRDTAKSDTFSTGAPGSTHDVDRWGRVSREPRVASSNYSNSVYYDNPGPPHPGGPDRQMNPMFPGSRSPSSYYGRNNRSASRGILSSDISWLNIGGNR